MSSSYSILLLLLLLLMRSHSQSADWKPEETSVLASGYDQCTASQRLGLHEK